MFKTIRGFYFLNLTFWFWQLFPALSWAGAWVQKWSLRICQSKPLKLSLRSSLFAGFYFETLGWGKWDIKILAHLSWRITVGLPTHCSALVCFQWGLSYLYPVTSCSILAVVLYCQVWWCFNTPFCHAQGIRDATNI